MPSPFPGMDPYLENPVLWSGVHQGIIGCARAALNAVLPPRYVADIGERIYVVQSDRSLYPDVVVFEQTPPLHAPRTPGRGNDGRRGGRPPSRPDYEPAEIREVFIEILLVGEEERVVTVIEVLSPSNKTLGSEGRELYLAKQRDVLRSQTHLIEIDLLRSGEHTVAPSRAGLHRRGVVWDYLISLHRGGQSWQYELWPTTLRQPLPRIRVPLADGEPDVALDLQAVLNRVYDEGAYARRLDYRGDPPMPLRDEDAQWADALLRERGLRP